MTLAFLLNIVGTMLGSLAASLYGIRVWMGKEEANLATWLIVLLLDLVGVYLAFVTGNDEPYIQIGWCFAAALIATAAWLRKGSWQWTGTETMVLVLCVASMAIWTISESAYFSLAGYLTAAYLSAFPQGRDYLRDPKAARKSAWVWQVSIVAILFPLSAKFVEQKYGMGHTLIYYALIVLNMIMAGLCMRRVT